jgi:chemotaxis protein CheD
MRGTTLVQAEGYFDPTIRVDAAKVLPGGYAVGGAELAFVTVLGSCVTACVRDPKLGIGGMNHFMLPEGEGADGASARYGNYAMEVLLNELMKRGAARARLEAKVVGGANVMRDIETNLVGTRNAEFVGGYLATEGIQVVGRDLLGTHGRKVYYFPATGRLAVRSLAIGIITAVARSEAQYGRTLAGEGVSGDAEFFG